MARTESRALLLAGLLALTACGATQPTPGNATPGSPAPVSAPRNLGLYELQINALSGPHAQASVQRYGTLTAQAGDVTGQLTFTQVSMSNLVDNTNKVVHMTATFRVTNQGTTDLTLPTFVPVDTDGTNGTDGTTPFRNVRTRTGAPATATGLKIEQSRQLSGGVIQTDPNATPLINDLDTGALNLNVPAGQTVPGIAHQGWQTGPLNAGQSQLVTFATSVPLKDSAIGDQDPFAFNLVFAATDAPTTVALTNIASVQGATPSGDAASPLSTQSVTVEGVVTSVNTANVTDSLKGFFIQEEGIEADSDATTSDGVFVYCSSNCPTVAVGDRVRVSGTVTEFQRSHTYPGNTPVTVTAPLTNTQITAPTVTVLISAIPLPPAISITPNLSVAQREQYEGMLVTTTGTVTNNFPLGRYSSVDLSANRITNYTQLNAPSISGYSAYTSDLPNQTLRIDNSNLIQNTEPPFGLNGQPLSASNTLRGGDRGTVTGVMHYEHDGYGNRSGSNFLYRIMTTSAQFDSVNPRLSAPEAVGGTLRVGAMNVLNYFTTLVNSNTGCTPNGVGGSAARGANNCDEFLRQQDKIVAAISGLNPDVLNLMEIQNDFDRGANSSVALLVQKLNATLGAGTYAYVNPGAKVGTDAISLAMIYKPAAVTPVGNLALLDNRFDPNYTDTCNRPSWAQTFQQNSGGGRFTAVALHLKSKGSSCSTLADADAGDGQGNGYKARENAATALVNWLATDPTGTGEADILLMGDYNAYAMEKPLSILATGGYANLFSSSSYSYQFDGQWGSLDHATGSASLATQVTGQTKWHINADEPTVLDYNREFKSAAQLTGFYAADAFRSSDHDPLLIGLNLTTQTPLPVTVTQTPDAASQTVTVSGAGVTQNFTSTLANATGPLNVTVTPVGSAPAIVTAPATANSGTPFTVTVQAPTGTPTGTYEYTVTTENGGISDTSTLTVTVNPAPTTTVTLTPSAASQTVTVNGAAVTQSYTASGTNLTGDLNITVTPVGSAPAIVSAPATATDGTPFTVTVQAPTGTAAGTYTYTVTAANSGQSSSSTLTVTVNPAPSITLSGTNKSVTVGAGTTTPVTVTRTNFTDTVTLSVDSVTGTGTAPSVTVNTQPGTGTSGTLNIDATGATTGTYTVTVRGTGAGISDATTTLTVTVAAVPPAGLIFSEYVEGTSNNKAIEIFNGTGQTLAANRISVKLYSNGGTTAGTTYTVGAALAPGQTFVITNSGSNATLAAKSNATSGVTNFNGDDALELLIDGTVVDTFGQVGFDPGTAWTVGSASTLDKTLRRKSTVTTGDANGTDVFDPSVEWDVYNVDTFDGLGAR